MVIDNIKDFKKQLLQYIDEDKIILGKRGSRIKIEELQDSGKGEIYIDIIGDDIIQIIPSEKISIGKNRTNCDGIVLSIDFKNKYVDVYVIELKKSLRMSNLEKATKQLYSAYVFIKYLNLEECFNVKYYFFIAIDENRLKLDYQSLKIANPYKSTLFESVYKNRDKIPIMQTFCKYSFFDFQLLQFGDSLSI